MAKRGRPMTRQGRAVRRLLDQVPALFDRLPEHLRFGFGIECLPSIDHYLRRALWKIPPDVLDEVDEFWLRKTLVNALRGLRGKIDKEKTDGKEDQTEESRESNGGVEEGDQVET